MKKHIINIINKHKTLKFYQKNYLSVVAQIDRICKSGDSTIVLTLDNTGTSYLGVKNAILNLFPENTVIIPAYYSNLLISSKHLRQIAEHLIDVKCKQLILGSFPPCFVDFVKTVDKRIIVKTIFHGALSELHEESKQEQFKQLINLCTSGDISALGFVKSGLAEWCRKSFGINAHWLQLIPIQKKEVINKYGENNIHIGIFGNNSFNKNIINQIAGALLIENAIIHVFSSGAFFEHFFKERIVVHKLMNHEEFICLLGSMHLNMHLSFSEGMGGQTFTESLSLGVPCLTSYNNEYLKKSTYLSDLLIVDQYDNPFKIGKAISVVLDMNLNQQLIEYSKIMEKEAVLLLNDFLDNS